MQTFKINDYLEVVCESEGTRYGFRHLATLLLNGIEREKAKRCYYNRTWESYEFESVLETLAEKEKILSKDEKKLFLDKIKNSWKEEDQKRVDQQFGTLGMVMAMGNLLAGDSQKSKNDWKTRMLKAGLENKGLIMPEDWNTLSEDTKQARLDGITKQFLNN